MRLIASRLAAAFILGLGATGCGDSANSIAAEEPAVPLLGEWDFVGYSELVGAATRTEGTFSFRADGTTTWDGIATFEFPSGAWADTIALASDYEQTKDSLILLFEGTKVAALSVGEFDEVVTLHAGTPRGMQYRNYRIRRR